MTYTPQLAQSPMPGAAPEPTREPSDVLVACVVAVAAMGALASVVVPLLGLPLVLAGFVGSLVLVRRASGVRAVVLAVSGVVTGLTLVLAAVVLLFLTPVSVESHVEPAVEMPSGR